MLLDCFDLGWEAFFHKYLVLQEKAVTIPDFAETMEACRAGRDPQWRSRRPELAGISSRDQNTPASRPAATAIPSSSH